MLGTVNSAVERTDTGAARVMEQEAGRPILGVDLGGTKILCGIVGPDHAILGRAKASTPAKRGQEAILAAILDCANEAIAAAGLTSADLAGIGVGSPGPLDTERGVILFSGNLNVKDFAIGPDVSAATGLPVIVRNDVTVGGYGEFLLGAGRGATDLLAAFVGTGIGGCVVVGGRVIEGSNGNAGEIGHIRLKSKGPRCGCGRRGCLEALASRTAIVRRIAKAHKQGVQTSLAETLEAGGSKVRSKQLAAAFEADDPLTRKEVGRAARYLGRGLGSLANVLGPERILIGGGVTEAIGEPFVALVREAAREQILIDPAQSIAIIQTMLGDDSGILGAALLAREIFEPGRGGSARNRG